jgi:hypothetical protein
LVIPRQCSFLLPFVLILSCSFGNHFLHWQLSIKKKYHNLWDLFMVQQAEKSPAELAAYQPPGLGLGMQARNSCDWCHGSLPNLMLFQAPVAELHRASWALSSNIFTEQGCTLVGQQK